MPAVVVIVLALLLIVAAFVSPLISIWALNVLFGFTIPVTLKTYAAAAWLSALVYGATSRTSSKS